MTLKQYLLNHPEKLHGDYNETGKKFNASSEQVRSLARRLRKLIPESPMTKVEGAGLSLRPEDVEEFFKWKRSKLITHKPSKRVLPKPYTGGNTDNVLVIADTHEPFCKEGYLEFCREQQEKFDCGTVIHIGDEVDLCAISQWEKDPDGLSASTEVEKAKEKMKDWFEVFPEVKVCIGNHSARIFRMARNSGIPKWFIKSYEEAWGAPEGWVWDENWEHNNILYTHGNGLSGANAAITLASQHRQSAVIGHIHTSAGIQYNASKKDLVWGMMLGGAINDKEYAFAYAKDNLRKSIVGCGIVLDKQALYIPMSL